MKQYKIMLPGVAEAKEFVAAAEQNSCSISSRTLDNRQEREL